MLGTAFPAGRILLVEQPGSWGPNGLLTSQFDATIARRLINTLGRRGVRVLAVRRPGRQPRPDVRRWAFADCRPGSTRLITGRFDADGDLLEFDPDDPRGTTADGPVYAVCAHGTHDACCAVEGRQAAAALELLRPGQVWECSHVGGDRFAANVLVLPSGQLYGRVTAYEDLVAATDDFRVLTGSLRGQVGLASSVQAAVVHVQRELGFDRFGQIIPAGRTTVTEGHDRVRLATPDGDVVVDVEQQIGEPAILTCRANRALRPISYRPVSLARV